MRTLVASWLLLFGLAAGVAAAEYEIEVIVFARLLPAADDDDDAQGRFSTKHTERRLARMATLNKQTSPFAVSTQLNNLEMARARLLESGYRIVNTARWRQPKSFYQDAPLISLHAQNSADDSAAAVTADDAADYERINTAEEHEFGENEFIGFVRVYTTALIYADVDLQLSPPSAPKPFLWLRADRDAAEPAHYFIAEKRRLKFQQVHYFDHPHFGAILGVWQAPEAAPDNP